MTSMEFKNKDEYSKLCIKSKKKIFDKIELSPSIINEEKVLEIKS
jgi:hypothetical protein